MPFQMIKILDCDATECAYNSNRQCHTGAITVGSDHPQCDTFIKLSHKGGAGDVLGAVGACRVEACKYNQALECAAPGIHIHQHANHADCATFVHR
jgi:Domain of Unknown Function (DUF1540)